MIRNKIIGLYKRGFFHIFAGNILNKLFAFVSSTMVVRLVSKTDYACLAYMDNIYSYVALFAGLGMATAILKYCSSDNRGKNKAYIQFALKYGTLIQVGILAFVLLYILLADPPFSGVKNLAAIYCLYPLMEYWLAVLYNAIRALLNNRLYVRMSVAQTASVMVLGIALVSLLGVKGILIARYMAVAMAGILGARFLIKEFKGIQGDKLSNQEIRAFMSMSLSLLVANLFSLAMPLNETFLINHLVRDEVVTANYKVATMFPAQLTFITNSILVYYFPIIARMRDKNEIWKTSLKIGVVAGMAIAVVSTLGIVLSKGIILMVYGERYMDSVLMSRIFWLVYSLNAGLRMVPMNLLPAMGYARFNAMVAGISCVAHLGLDSFMIANAGISGVAVATSMVYFLSGIAYWVYLYLVCKKYGDVEVV